MSEAEVEEVKQPKAGTPRKRSPRLAADQDKAVERAIGDRRALFDATLQLARWLLATLFILNGVAALTTLGMEGVPPPMAVKAASIFVVGLSAAIIGGMSAFLCIYVGLMRADAVVQKWNERRWYPAFDIITLLIAILSLLLGIGSVWMSVKQFSDGVEIVSAAKERGVVPERPSAVSANLYPNNE